MANYENEKWDGFARTILRFGSASDLFSQGRIAVSPSLAERMSKSYRVSVRTIPNGIDPPLRIRPESILQSFGLTQGRYFLTVARIDEQKRQLDLIADFARLGQTDWKLVLVGGADYRSGYARTVEEAAHPNSGVVMLGVQSGKSLAALYAGAGAFVLPSSHEGQPIAKTVKSWENTQTARPSIVPWPVTTASPQGRFLSMSKSAVRWRTKVSSSSKEPGSSSFSMRSRAVSLPFACCFSSACGLVWIACSRSSWSRWSFSS